MTKRKNTFVTAFLVLALALVGMSWADTTDPGSGLPPKLTKGNSVVIGIDE